MNAGVFFTKNIFFNPKTFEETELNINLLMENWLSL